MAKAYLRRIGLTSGENTLPTLTKARKPGTSAGMMTGGPK
jgi:hypothetical protein